MPRHEVGDLIWAKPNDETDPIRAKAFFTRPAVVVAAKQTDVKVVFFNSQEDDHSSYLDDSVMNLPNQWVNIGNCMSWDEGSAELLRQKDKHIRRVLQERCQLWIIDSEYQRVRNILTGREDFTEKVKESLSEDHLKKLRTKARYTIHPVGKVRKINTVSGRSSPSALSDDETKLSTPEVKRKRDLDETFSSVDTKLTKNRKQRNSFSPALEFELSDIIDEDASRIQISALGSDEVRNQILRLRDVFQVMGKIRSADAALVSDLGSVDRDAFAEMLFSIRLSLSAMSDHEYETTCRTTLQSIREAILNRICKEWDTLEPPIREACLNLVETIS